MMRLPLFILLVLFNISKCFTQSNSAITSYKEGDTLQGIVIFHGESFSFYPCDSCDFFSLLEQDYFSNRKGVIIYGLPFYKTREQIINGFQWVRLDPDKNGGNNVDFINLFFSPCKLIFTNRLLELKVKQGFVLNDHYYELETEYRSAYPIILFDNEREVRDTNYISELKEVLDAIFATFTSHILYDDSNELD